MITLTNVVPWALVSHRKRVAAILQLGAVVSLILLTPISVQAASQYWVVVGSYPTLKRAEQARLEASTELSEAFDVRGGNTPTDYVYRVVVGPYETATAARQMLAEAHAGPYEEAWILPEKIDQLLQTAATHSTSADPGSQSMSKASEVAPAFQSRPDRFDGRYDSGLNRKNAAVPESSREAGSQRQGPGLDRSPEDERPEELTELSKVPHLVEQAPSSYNLHKLRRDSAP